MNLFASRRVVTDSLRRPQALCLPIFPPAAFSIYLHQIHSHFHHSSPTHTHHMEEAESASFRKGGKDAAQYFN